MDSYSDLLFARPSFFGGMASAVDPGASLVDYNVAATPEEADRRANWADWRQIGEDMRHAIEDFGAEHASAGTRARQRKNSATC